MRARAGARQPGLPAGGFVAGNDAGRAFNDFPFFAGRWVPEGWWDERFEPAWRNVFENTGLVQMNHRALAITTWAGATAMFVAARRNRALFRALPRASQLWLHSFAGMASVQALLGISTLMLYVPVSLGAAHQVGGRWPPRCARAQSRADWRPRARARRAERWRCGPSCWARCTRSGSSGRRCSAPRSSGCTERGAAAARRRARK